MLPSLPMAGLCPHRHPQQGRAAGCCQPPTPTAVHSLPEVQLQNGEAAVAPREARDKPYSA